MDGYSRMYNWFEEALRLWGRNERIGRLDRVLLHRRRDLDEQGLRGPPCFCNPYRGPNAPRQDVPGMAEGKGGGCSWIPSGGAIHMGYGYRSISDRRHEDWGAQRDGR